MKNELLYCPVCQKKVSYITKIVKAKDEKENIIYDEVVALCPCCGEELYSDEIMKTNMDNYKKAYSLANDVITTSEIEAILTKYRISKRNLPLILGIGEQTITRYLDGYIPRKKISDLLKEIDKEPIKYYELLEQNKDKINRSAYVKSKNELDAILGIEENDTLIEDVAEYIVINNPDTTNLTLQKMEYYTNVFSIILYGKSAFTSKCGAWQHGPAYGRIYYKYKFFGNKKLAEEEINIQLDDNLKKIVDAIIKYFGCYSGKVLSYFTHSEDPWKKAHDAGNEFIEEKDLIDFALEIKDKYDIKNVNDIKKYSDAKYDEYTKKYINI